jgi:flavodoxin/ferredoxin
MRVCIIYFSQTGNTRKIAQNIEKGIFETGAQCRLVRFEDFSIETLQSFEMIGIGCPVFYYQEPLHIRLWLQSLPDLMGQHWFVFCTHGNILGNFFPSMAELLRSKGAMIVGYFHSYAGIRVPYLPSPGFTEGHPDATDLARAIEFGRQMVYLSQEINGIDSSKIPASRPVSSSEWVAEAARFSPDFLPKTMPQLQWNEEICTGCGTCEDECPVGGIDLEATPPSLQSPCISCWNCVSRCSALAITADWKRLIAFAPEYFARCRKELDREAEKGNFRWLIEPDSVDVSDVFILKRNRLLLAQKKS